jgi:hypothetical protein
MPYFRLVGGFRFLFVFGLCCALAVSCATSPRLAEKDESIEDTLPPGAVMYGFAGVRYMGDLIESLMSEQFNNKQTAAFIKKTESAVFGLYRTVQVEGKTAAQSVFLITEGNYPASSYNFGLALSPKWKSAVIDGKKWWQQGTTALLFEKTRAYIRLGDSSIPPTGSSSSNNEEISVLFDKARISLNAGSDDSPIVFASFISSPETSGLIRRMGIPLDIALENITLEVSVDEAVSYRSTLRLKAKSPSEAKALLAILSLARTIIGKRVEPSANEALIAELIFGNPPMLDGSTIAVTGAFPMDALISSIKHFNLFSSPPES